jgi:poly(3-hydroxybutyrate) depolymerase
MAAHRALAWFLSGLFLAPAASTVSARVLDQTATIAGMTFRYKVVLPADYDAGKSYPAILAFPPGSQDMNMVMTTLQQNWAGQAQRRGYIVVIPAAPEGRLFFQDGARVFPAFLDQLLASYPIRDRQFHIAGMSNGGISAFFIAAAYPKYFTSVTGFPGFLPDATPERIAALSGMCVHLHVGELDTGWRQMMEEQAAEFRAKGFSVDISVEKGQSHVMSTLMGDGAARLFDEIENSPHGCRK